ncbi:hypothetical protein HRI_000627800 [Hibiscus trionum]|uniref:Hydrophobic seed protein domain-containing protein n=1 Tax=Hibiscus trionum TaxID=183268 RepID=A0A9W7H1Y7_HIBTR|nr:hypothetical protein HRI_000627800 [Hibiscus trionum]
MASNFQGFTTVFLLSLNLLFFTPVLAPPPSSCSGRELGDCFSLPSDQNSPCCRQLSGLTDLEAADCLCANFVPTTLRVPEPNILIQLILERCGKQLPPDHNC